MARRGGHDRGPQREQQRRGAGVQRKGENSRGHGSDSETVTSEKRGNRADARTLSDCRTGAEKREGAGAISFSGRRRWRMGCQLAAAIWVDLLRRVALG